MKLLLVPHSSDRTTARIWLAVADTSMPPATFALHVPGVADAPVPQHGWRAVTGGGSLGPADSRTFVQTVTVSGLSPGVRYIAHAGDARARFSTLPDALPRHGAGTFNVLLTSCFYIGGGDSGAVGAAVRNLPEHLVPDVKFLTGDQVYLDFPAFIFGLPIRESSLARSFLDKYRRNWSQDAGYQDLLSTGCTYFTADDHEFWNNYPNPATLIGNTWLIPGGRDRLRRVGRSLFEDFQCESPAAAGVNRRFSVGPLSFFIADTRIGREEGDERFMAVTDFQDMTDWIDGLSAPGVLVVGQPLFEEPANWFNRRIVDRSLSNYAQYTPLVAALYRCPHSVLVLTGDVHYGRVVRARWITDAGVTEVAEVIASPSSLVFGRHAAPATVNRFPPEPIGHVPQASEIRMHDMPVRSANHFATLHFSDVPGRIRVAIRHWYFDGARTGVHFTENHLDLL
jgi:hypothetical protein